MKTAGNLSDPDLAALLEQRADGQADFWRFSTPDLTRSVPEPYQYPAMMVSAMQGELLSVICERRGEQPTVADFFVGSGTTLAQAMRLGCSFVGCDINPLAVLLSTVKAESRCDVDIPAGAHMAIAAARADTDTINVSEPWVGKWFRRDVALSLARVKRGISRQPDPRVRRALWVALAEVVRTSGNMQIRRPKLQTRPAGQLVRYIDVYERFWQAANRVAAARSWLAQDSDINVGPAAPQVVVSRGDVRDFHWPEGLEKAGIVITSPPYGDNHTTMPYGQHSYLPLRWIDPEDIPGETAQELISASKTLDTQSLGGSRRLDHDRVSEAAQRSVTLTRALKALVDRREPWTRVASFFADLAEAWQRIVPMTQADAHFVLTIGDRTVGGVPIATTAIIEELLGDLGLETMARWGRPIGQKRLAPRNLHASRTINDEVVLIMQRR